MTTNNVDTSMAETVFYHKCRVCLQQGTVQIFSEHVSSDIRQNLMIFGDIEITENDNYPKCLCKHCLNSLKAAIEFRNTAKKTQSILKKLEQSSNKKLSQIYVEEEIEISNVLEALDAISPQNSDEKNRNKIFKEEDHMWNDFEEHHQTSDKSSSAEEIDDDLNPSCKKDGIEKNEIDQAELQIVPDRPPHYSSDHTSSWKEENESANSLEVPLRPSQSLNENIKQICKDKEIKYSSTLDIQQKTQCMNKNVNKTRSKIIKLKTWKRPPAKSTQCSDETTSHICGEEEIKNLKASEVTAHCDKYFKAIQVADSLNYQCNICKKTILSKHSRALHLVAHLPLSEFSFICEVCGKKFVRKGDLQQHLSIHYVNPVFQCDMCPYKGHTRELLRCHKRVHSDQFRYSCTVCPKKFKSNGNLHVHLRRHGKPMFPCETCHKSFYENASLKKHVESQHLGIRELSKCDQCGKVYLQRKKMLEHQNKVHKREKVYTRAHYLKAESNLS